MYISIHVYIYIYSLWLTIVTAGVTVVAAVIAFGLLKPLLF